MPVPPIVVPEGFRIIAHRGASAYAPENTLAAFRLAREMDATEVETDVQLSADGALVLCHDETLDRYGHGTRVVEEMDSRELLALDMGSWFSPHSFRNERMGTLRTLFETFADEFVYHVEIKGKRDGLQRELARLVDAFGLDARVIVTSFRLSALARMHAEAPRLRLGWLVERIDLAAAASAGVPLFQLCPSAATVTPEDVAKAKSLVREVRAWGLSGPPARVRELIARVVEAGCDGMTINWPDWVVHAAH